MGERPDPRALDSDRVRLAWLACAPERASARKGQNAEVNSLEANLATIEEREHVKRVARS